MSEIIKKDQFLQQEMLSKKCQKWMRNGKKECQKSHAIISVGFTDTLGGGGGRSVGTEDLFLVSLCIYLFP